jgi:hypothetical protein
MITPSGPDDQRRPGHAIASQPPTQQQLGQAGAAKLELVRALARGDCYEVDTARGHGHLFGAVVMDGSQGGPATDGRHHGRQSGTVAVRTAPIDSPPSRAFMVEARPAAFRGIFFFQRQFTSLSVSGAL